MTGSLYNLLVGGVLFALMTLTLTLMAVGACRMLSRQFSRLGFLLFVVSAGVATVQAQKIRYVDAHAPRKGNGLTWETAARSFSELGGWFSEGTTIYVKPGIYSPFKYASLYHGYDLNDRPIAGEAISVVAVDPDPRKTIIDGGGTNTFIRTGLTDDEPVVLSLAWRCLYFKGVTISNLNYQVEESELDSCVLTGFDRTVIGYDSIARNCLITGNRLPRNEYPQYSTEWLFEADALVNCTIAGNDLSNNYLGHASFKNCIIWGNESENPERAFAWSWQKAQNNCSQFPISDWGGKEMEYLSVDPLFVDASAGDFRLRMGSPCINAGDNAAGVGESDLVGNSRIARSTVDLGCYEYQPTNEHQTITAPVPVEFAWLDERCPELLTACGGDYDKVVLMKSANPVDLALPEPMRTYYSIWESYIADLDPTDSNQTFRATIEMLGGEPVVKADPESPRRKYTILGKEKLTDDSWQENLPGAQFFKVKVNLK